MPRGKRKTSQSEDEKEKENDPSNISSEEAVWRKKLQAILDEFDIEVESRCLTMQNLADKLAMDLRNALHVELLKLPKKYRTMTMKEFHEKYQGDWNAFFKSGAPSAAPTPLKTPVSTPAPAKITIALDDGGQLELGGPDALQLNPRAREEARQKLLALQAQINAIMGSLK